MVYKIPLMRDRTNLSDNGFSLKEQEIIYDETLDSVLKNARWYLNNLENIKTYRVGWHNYRYDYTPVPYKYVKKQPEK